MGLRVYVQSSLKVAIHVDGVAKKMYTYSLSLVSPFSIKVRTSCCSCIKLYLGHVWSSECSADCHTTGRMWRLWRQCKQWMLPGLMCNSQKQKLDKLELFSLNLCRPRGKLKEVYTMMTDIGRRGCQ